MKRVLQASAVFVSRSRHATASALLLLLCIVAQQRYVSTQGAPAGTYRITDLGTLGGTTSQAFGVNRSADAVGSAQRADGASHAFLFTGNTLKDLGTLGGASSVAMDANRSGDVVGQSLSSSGNTTAFLYTKAAGMKPLATLGGSRSIAYGINDAGEIVGSTQASATAPTRAFIYRSGAVTILNSSFGGTTSVATAINESGEIAGSASTTGNASTHAFWFSGGVMKDVHTLGVSSEATGLNVAAQVVGRVVLASGARHAFLYTGGAMQDLQTLGGRNSEAAAINDWSQVVGTSDVAGGGTHAFLYQNGVLTDLNTVLPANSGWVLEAATAINESGEIVGYGRINGQRHGYRLTPAVVLSVRSGGSLSLQDSNIPRNGVQAGRTVTFVTTVQVGDDGTARNVVVTDTMTGPIEIQRIRLYRGSGTCTVAAKTATCKIPALGIAAAFEEEVWVDVRVTGPGAFSHTAHASADNNTPDSRIDTLREDNIGIALADFTLSATTVAGGKAVLAKATLTSPAPPGGAVVSIVSSNPAVAQMTSRLVVQLPGASRTFNIVPAVVSQPTTVTISATYGLVTISRTLTVVPPALSTVSLTRTTLIGSCQTATAKVTLTGAAPASGATVRLATTTAGLNTPSSITVPAGATSASLTLTGRAVSTISKGTFTAAFGGVSKGLSLTVRPIYVQGVVLTPSTVAGGGTVSGQATIECAAPAGGMTVTLSSTNAAVAAPTTASLVLPAGATHGGFSVRTKKPATATTVTIRAAAHAVTKNAALTVTP